MKQDEQIKKTLISWNLANCKEQGQQLSLISPPHHLSLLSLRKELFSVENQFFQQDLNTCSSHWSIWQSPGGKQLSLADLTHPQCPQVARTQVPLTFCSALSFCGKIRDPKPVTPSMVYSAPVTSVLPSLIHIRDLHPQWEYLSTVFNLMMVLTGNMKFHIIKERPGMSWWLSTIKTGYGTNLHFDKIN